MTRSRRQILQEYGARPSRDSRRLMAARIAELEQLVERVRAVKRTVVDTGFGAATVVFAADLERVLKEPRS